MPRPNTNPIAPDTIARFSIVLAAANTARDGTTGTYTTLLTAGNQGAIIPTVRAYHAGAISVAASSMVVRLWHQVAGAGSRFMIDEVVLTSATPTATVIGGSAVFNRTNIELGAGDVLAVTISVAEAVHFSAGQGNY